MGATLIFQLKALGDILSLPGPATWYPLVHRSACVSLVARGHHDQFILAASGISPLTYNLAPSYKVVSCIFCDTETFTLTVIRSVGQC